MTWFFGAKCPRNVPNACLSLAGPIFSSCEHKYNTISEPLGETNCRAAIGRIFKAEFSD